jgi:hypothetical protein
LLIDSRKNDIALPRLRQSVRLDIESRQSSNVILSPADEPGRISSDHATGWNGLGHDGIRPNDAAPPDVNARQDYGVVSNKGMVSDLNSPEDIQGG